MYGHAGLAGNFDRYKKTLGWNTAINKRQFAIAVDRFRWPENYRYPDVTYETRASFRSGSLTFELHHGLGETDDATWTFVPERKILHPGDLFIWAAPNAGNPQKVQRYAGEWATALREMAGTGAEIMVPGHGLPIFGADRIRTALLDTAELLEVIESQVLALMNTGATLDRVLHEVEMPARLLDKPYLRPVYDHPQFIVRNVWRLYGGWYDGEPDNLLPAPRAEQAREWVALAGGIDAVLERAGRCSVKATCGWRATWSSSRSSPSRAQRLPTHSAPRSTARARSSNPPRCRRTSSTTPRSPAHRASATSPAISEAEVRGGGPRPASHAHI